MGKTYDRADETTIAEVQAAMKRYHGRLCSHDVTLDVVMVSDIDEESGENQPALKHQGYWAAATIKVTPLRERALGHADALMTIDAFSWNALGREERAALLDHELTHLKFVLHEDGSVQRDDQKRPKMKLRLHDVHIGGFREVMDRHGERALEVKAVRACRDAETGQYVWDFDDAGEPEKSSPRSVTLTPAHRKALANAAAAE